MTIQIMTSKTITAYKLVRVRKDGTLGSLFINKKEILLTNKWLEAKPYPTKGYKNRMGWHCLLNKSAPHPSMKNRVWVKVKIKDFELNQRPENQGGMWALAKYMKILGVVPND